MYMGSVTMPRDLAAIKGDATISRTDAEFAVRAQLVTGNRAKFDALWEQLYRKYARVGNSDSYIPKKAHISVGWFISNGLIVTI